MTKQKLHLISDSNATQNVRELPQNVFIPQNKNASNQTHKLHSLIKYQGTLKQDLITHCINKFSEVGQTILDPFCGDGIVPVQAIMQNRIALASDINPLATHITSAKMYPARIDEVIIFLNKINFKHPVSMSGYQEYFAEFYHPDTYTEIINLKNGIKQFRAQGLQTKACNFVELLTLSLLHGHLRGYLSSYSSPNIALSPKKQATLNKKRREIPEYRAIVPRIMQRSAQVLRDGITTSFLDIASSSLVKNCNAHELRYISANSVDLVLTSLPLLHNFNYYLNYWLEHWFCGVDIQREQQKQILNFPHNDWVKFINETLQEMLRVTKPNAFVALEISQGMDKNNSSLLNELKSIIISVAKRVRHYDKQFMVREVIISKAINQRQEVIVLQVR